MARGKVEGRYTPRRRRGGGESDDSNRWLGTYGDMVTLLMAFFVMLYAMSEVDIQKFQAFLEGLVVPFGNVSAEGMMPAADGLLPDDQGVEPEPEPTQLAEQLEVDLARAAQREAAEAQLEEVSRALDASLEAAGLSQYVVQRREERGLIVTIAADDVLFQTGSARIGPVGREVIATVSATLDGFPNPLLVEGHTDDVPLNRNGYTNWNLSSDRAVSVLSLMIEQHGLPPDRVGAVGYGEYRPVAANDSKDGRARNRRVDIVVAIDEEQTG